MKLPKIFKKLWPLKLRRERPKGVLKQDRSWTDTQRKLVGVHM